MKRSSRTASRRFGFAADSASPTSPSKPSFDHISHVGQGEPHNTQNSPMAPSRDEPDGENAKTPIVPWMRRARRLSLVATPTYQGPSVKEEHHGDSPEKGGHSLRKRARVNYASEHIEEDLFTTSSTAPRTTRKRKPYGIEEPEDFSGPKAKRRNTSMGVDTPSTRRRNPARKPVEPKETKSFTANTNTSFGNHFNDDNDIIRDTIEVGLSPSDMELVDSDELSSVGSSPSPKQEDDAPEHEAESSHAVSREVTQEPDSKSPAIKGAALGAREPRAKAPNAKRDVRSTAGKPVFIATLKVNLAKLFKKRPKRTGANAASVANPTEPNSTDVKETKAEDTEVKKPEPSPDPGETETPPKSPIETEAQGSKEVGPVEAGAKETESKKLDSEVAVPIGGNEAQAESKEALPEPVEVDETKTKDPEPEGPVTKDTEPEGVVIQNPEPKETEAKPAPEDPKESKDDGKDSKEPKSVDVEMKDAETMVIDEDSGAKNDKPSSSGVEDTERSLLETSPMTNESKATVDEPVAETDPIKPKDTDVQDAKLKDTEVQSIEAESADVQYTEPESTGAQETEPKPAEVKETDPKDASANDTEIKDVEIEGAASNDSAADDAVMNDAEVKDPEPKDIDMKDAEANDAEAKDMVDESLEVRDTEIKESQPEESEIMAAEPKKPDLMELELTEPEPKEPETIEAELKEHEPQGPEPQEPEPKEPEHKEPEHKEPEHNEPEHKEPESEEPESKEPESKEPESKEPEPKEPEPKEFKPEEPELEVPESKEPEPKEPEPKEFKPEEPELEVPESKEPEQKEPEQKEPEQKEPEQKEPEPKESEPKEPEPKESEIQEIRLENSELKGPELKEPTLQEPESKESEPKDSEPKESEVKESEVKESGVKDTEVKDTEVKDAEVEDIEGQESDSRVGEAQDIHAPEIQSKDTARIEVPETNNQDVASQEAVVQDTKPNEAETNQVKSPRTEIPSVEPDAQTESHEGQNQVAESNIPSLEGTLQGATETKDVEMNEAGSSQEHQLTQENADISMRLDTQDDEESPSNQLRETQAESQDHTVGGPDDQEKSLPADASSQPQTPTEESSSQPCLLPSNTESKVESETPTLSTSYQTIVESPEDTTVGSPPPNEDISPSDMAVNNCNQDDSVANQQKIAETLDDNSTATSVATPVEPNLPVDTVMQEPVEAEEEEDTSRSKPASEQSTKPAKSLESSSKKPMPAPIGRWSHLTPYVEGEFTSYPEKRERSEDDDGNEDPSQETSKEANDPDIAADENDDLPDVGTSELPTGALNTPTRGSPVPESLDIAASGSPAPANEDADDPEIPESQEPMERALRFKYRKLRDADEYISVLENYETMKTEDLYEMLQAINVSLVEWQDEWSLLGKVVDDFENASRRRLADAKYESRTRNLNQHGINFEEPDFAVKGYKAKEKELMSETRYLQQQDRTMAAAYGFEYDPHPSKIGRQNPETQQAGVTTRGRALRNQPRQTAKATETDGVTGKRQRKPVQLFDPTTQEVSRSSTPVPTRGKRRRNAENDDAQSMPTSSFNEDGMSDVETTPNKRRRGPRAKASTSRSDGLSSQTQDNREEPSKSFGRRGRNKTYTADEELEKSKPYEDLDGHDDSKPRRLLTLKIPKGTTISDTASTIEDNGDLRPSTASSDSTSHTVESSYSFRPKRQKRFRDEPDNGDEPAQAPAKKRGRRTNANDNRGDHGLGEGSAAPSETTSNVGTGRKAPKIKVMRPAQESRNGTPTSQPTTEGGDDQPKEYRAMTKSEKMSASMKNRWANGNMAGAVEKRKATLAAKKAAQVAADQKVGPIAPKQKNNNTKPSKKEASLPGEGPAFVHSPQFPHIPPTQHGAQHQHVAPHPQTHPHDLPPMGIPFQSSR